MKQITGMVPTTGPDDLCTQLHLDNMENMKHPDIANPINRLIIVLSWSP